MSEVNINSVSERFQHHLSVKNNFRIIFSGKYGIGKSFFLNKFFDERKDFYNKIIISPVNYSISSNENIFELIKADILKDLFLTGKIDLVKFADDTLLQRISKYIENNPLTIPNFLLRNLSKLNPLSETPIKIVEGIGKIIEDYKKKNSKRTGVKEKTLSQEVADYLFAQEEIEGSIYEHNYITKAINVFLKEIRGDKKNVLIIDDLDRVDPEHLFRILNILSAHNNNFDSENKFLFDHIILVCDIDNVKNIFEHKYGKHVDFDGYLDKFYSTELFFFENKDAIITYVNEINELKKENVESISFLVYLLEELVRNNFLTIRKLLKAKYDFPINDFIFDKDGYLGKQNFHYSPSFISELNNVYITSSSLQVLKIFKIMSMIFGDFRAFEGILDKLLKIESEVVVTNEQISILGFLLLQKHIVEAKGLKKYVSYEYYDNGRNVSRIANSVGWPKVSWGDVEFKISLKWTSGNPYDGSVSYFEGAKIYIQPDEIERETFSYQMVFIYLKELITALKEKKLFEKIPITGV